MGAILPLGANEILQKSAEPHAVSRLPKEILNPLNAVRKYSLRMPLPSAELANLIDHYWMLQWDRRGKSGYTCEVIPSPYINLTFSHAGAIVTGITTGKYTYELKEIGMIFGVKFRPGAFYAFRQRPLSELTDQVLPASTLFAGIDESVNGTIISKASVEDRVAYVERILLDMRPIADGTIALVNDIITSVEFEEKPTVGSVARAFGMSERSVQQLFHDRVGVGLKWIIRRVRLQKAAGVAAKLTSPNWANVAIELGYADQSHFINDFKSTIGMSPTRYAALVHTSDEVY